MEPLTEKFLNQTSVYYLYRIEKFVLTHRWPNNKRNYEINLPLGIHK